MWGRIAVVISDIDGLSPTGDEDVGAFGDEPLRGRKTDSTTAAGNDGDLPIKGAR
jgi:hypothetical protein